jgi:hypothetical protein
MGIEIIFMVTSKNRGAFDTLLFIKGALDPYD